MHQFDTIAIVGVGLIGASVGLAVRARGLAGHVVGIGRRAASLRKAKDHGAVDKTTTDLEKGVANANLVVVCTPVDLVVEHVQRAVAAAPPDCLVTDAGSTKAAIVRELDRLLPRAARFVGSHPMAGGENSGPEHGSADLFEGRTVVVTPTRRSQEQDVRAVHQFWQSLGAGTLEMTPARHDQAAAATSHVPHLAAAAIAVSTSNDYSALVATGWRDTTRIAAGDPAMWRQIVLANRQNVLRSLAQLEKKLAAIRSAIEREDGRRLQQLLEEAKRIRDALGN